MAPKCLSATWPPFSLRIALSSNYLCRSPAMTAVLSSNMAPSDRWGLNNGDMAPLTRVRVNDFSCHFGGCIRQLQGPFVFTSIFYQIEALSVQPRFRNLDRQSQTGYEVIFFMNQAGTAGSTPHRLCLLFITQWLLISAEWLQYWPCGRGFGSCPPHRARSDCRPLFAILYWSWGID